MIGGVVWGFIEYYGCLKQFRLILFCVYCVLLDVLARSFWIVWLRVVFVIDTGVKYDDSLKLMITVYFEIQQMHQKIFCHLVTTFILAPNSKSTQSKPEFNHDSQRFSTKFKINCIIWCRRMRQPNNMWLKNNFPVQIRLWTVKLRSFAISLKKNPIEIWLAFDAV